MYHIKDDKRTLVSATLIYEGLIALLEKTPNIDKITISDIQRESSVSRATFYRLFDDVIDVLIWKCDSDYIKVFNKCVSEMKSRDSKYACIETYFRTWQERGSLLEVLVKIHRTDIVFNSFIDNYHIITDRYTDVENFNKDPRFFAALRSGVAFATLCYWIESGKKQTPEELMNFLMGELKFVMENEIFF